MFNFINVFRMQGKGSLIFGLTCLVTFQVLAQGPDFTQKEVIIPMLDGVRLAADLYLPGEHTPDRYAVILIRTPYQKEGIADIAGFFVSQGFAVLVQDVRGKNKSEGKFIPFVNEKSDGIQTLKWIADQSWFNGSIGMWGSSYLGFSALALADTGYPFLKSIFHYSGWINGGLINNPGNAFHQQLIIPWLTMEGQQFPEAASALSVEEILTHIPLQEVYPDFTFKDENGDSIQLSGIDELNKDFHFSNVSIPIFHLSGWYDFALMGMLDTYENIKNKSSTTQQMRIGPWYHNQLYDESIMLGEYELPINARKGLGDLLQWSVKWFNETLNPQAMTGTSHDQISYYVLFENVWRESSTWPPDGAVDHEFFLSSGTLDDKKPGNGKSRFVYDPHDPVKTTGGSTFNIFPHYLGIRDQETVESREDVLLFTSEPFSTDCIYAGSARVNLYIGSDARSTDFTAKLTKVDKNKRSLNIADGIVRISTEGLRHQPTRVSIELGDVAFKIQAGEQLRLQITSSNFPKFNRNPNTGIDPIAAEKFIPASQTVFHNSRYSSKLVLMKIQ